MSRCLYTIGPVPNKARADLVKRMEFLEASAKKQLSSSKILAEDTWKVFSEAKKFVGTLLDKNTPSFRLTASDGNNAIFPLFSYYPEHRAFLMETQRVIGAILHEKGYRYNITTLREHMLAGSTVTEDYSKTPDVPIGILTNKLTVEEAGNARALVMLWPVLPSKFGLEGKNGDLVVFYEPLEPGGKTLRSPRLVEPKIFMMLLENGALLEEAIRESEIQYGKRPDILARRS